MKKLLLPSGSRLRCRHRRRGVIDAIGSFRPAILGSIHSVGGASASSMPVASAHIIGGDRCRRHDFG